MIDLDSALADQSDLRALCAKREGFESVEKHLPNEGYGFARAMKLYAGYPLDRPINAVVPHGVYLNAETMLPDELAAPVPAVLNYPAFRARVWERDTDRVLVPSASPFLYALSLFRDEYPDTGQERRGTLFFPGHIVSKVRTSTVWESLARELSQMDERFQPVTVCIYYVDYWAGHHIEFEKMGLPVVSAGNHADREFIFRWLHLLSRHRYAASNSLGSSIYYARKAGVPTFLTKELIRHTGDPALSVLAQHQPTTQLRKTKAAISDAFSGDPEAESDDRDALVDYLLGAENFRSPEGLLSELERVAELG